MVGRNRSAPLSEAATSASGRQLTQCEQWLWGRIRIFLRYEQNESVDHFGYAFLSTPVIGGAGSIEQAVLPDPVGLRQFRRCATIRAQASHDPCGRAGATIEDRSHVEDAGTSDGNHSLIVTR